IRRDGLFTASPSRKQNHDSLFNSCSTAFITVIFPSKISLFNVSTCVCFPSCSKNRTIIEDSNDSSNQCCNYFLRLSDQKPISVIFSFLYSKYLFVFVFLPAQKTYQLAQSLMIPRTSVVIGFYAFLTKNRSQSFFHGKIEFAPKHLYVHAFQ